MTLVRSGSHKPLANTSNAVRLQRVEPRDSLDDFPTLPWGTRALIEHVIKPRLSPEAIAAMPQRRVWEPACNRGYMVRPLSEYFGPVLATDVHDYGWAGHQETIDFIGPGMTRAQLPAELLRLKANRQWIDWVITNAPFKAWEQFALRCLELELLSGFALLARSGITANHKRGDTVFRAHPPTIEVQFAYPERLSLVAGTVDPEADLATDYSWFVWMNGQTPKPGEPWQKMLMPRCRAQLEKPGDYVKRQDEEDEE